VKRLLRPWLLYAAALLIGLGAMGWITRQALRSERAERASRRRADRAEAIRLALWRMDSTMALFLAPEAARPWWDFEPFHAAEGGQGRRVLAPSPSLVAGDPMVILRFQVDPSNRFSSPLVPGPGDLALAKSIPGAAERLTLAGRRLAEVQGQLAWSSIREAMTRQGAVLLSADQMRDLRARTGGSDGRRTGLESPFRDFHGAWAPFWDRGRLFMVRQVWVHEEERLQGCWLDWEALREVLMSTVRHHLPGAELVPALPVGEEAPGEGGEGRLSSLPVRLVVGSGPIQPAGDSPARGVLLAGWGFALLGALGGGVALVRSTLQSERRGAFASAVAHELRTPLTTFRLYTDLLAGGMVQDPQEQSELHRTLAAEAERLDHLVKNVLAYTRLEAGREVNLTEVGLNTLIERMKPRLEARAGQAGLPMTWEIPGEALARRLTTDGLLVEQILYNLVDNACKYAGGSGEAPLRMAAEVQEGEVRLRVQDSGPGIPEGERGQLFRPFAKIGPREARKAPGVGLGLALCRRMARALGGDLTFDPAGPGAAFVLRLPLLP